MKLDQLKESLWFWIGAVPLLIVPFINDPATAGVFFSLAIASVVGAVVPAIGLIKGLMKIMSSGMARTNEGLNRCRC